jgi:hypothetical protein
MFCQNFYFNKKKDSFVEFLQSFKIIKFSGFIIFILKKSKTSTKLLVYFSKILT